MRIEKAQGSYTRKSTGEVITFEYEFPQLEEGDIEIRLSPEAQKVFEGKKLTPFEIVNQTLKEDARNNGSTRAKVENGDIERKVLTPEEKAQRQAERKQAKALLELLKKSGKSIDDIKSLL